MPDTTTKKLDGTGLQQVWSLILANFAAKALVSEMKTKLDTVAENAQVNVIESVKVNGVALEVTEKGVNIEVPTGTLAGLDEVGIDNLNTALKALINGKVDASDVYTKTEVDNKIDGAISNVYVFKGSINFAELPTEGLKSGHTYNIKDAFDYVFGDTTETDPTAMTEGDVADALSVAWDGSSSPDPTALSSTDVTDAVNTEWDGSSSTDPEALNSTDIENATINS